MPEFSLWLAAFDLLYICSLHLWYYTNCSKLTMLNTWYDLPSYLYVIWCYMLNVVWLLFSFNGSKLATASHFLAIASKGHRSIGRPIYVSESLWNSGVGVACTCISPPENHLRLTLHAKAREVFGLRRAEKSGKCCQSRSGRKLRIDLPCRSKGWKGSGKGLEMWFSAAIVAQAVQALNLSQTP